VHDAGEAVSFYVPELDSFSISLASYVGPLGDAFAYGSYLAHTGYAMGFVKLPSGEQRPIPTDNASSASSRPAGVARTSSGQMLTMQVRDVLELAGFEYLTCEVSEDMVRNRHAVKSESCVPAEPWRHSRPPPPMKDLGHSWMVQDLSDVQDLPDDSAFFNATLVRHPQVNLGPFRLRLMQQYKFFVNIDWTNACPWSFWQREAWTRCGIVSIFLGKGPMSYVVSAEVKPNPQTTQFHTSVEYAYGKPPLKKTVSHVSKGHVAVQVRSDVRVFCSFSKLLSVLAGYSVLFSACSFVLQLLVVNFSKHRAAYRALITQRSADFSQLEDMTKSCKEFVEKSGGTFDPKEHKTTPHGMSLARALESLPENPGTEDVLLVLLAHEQRLNALDALDEPNTNEAEKDVFRKYLAGKDQELTQRSQAAKKREPLQRGQAENSGSSRPLLSGCARSGSCFGG